MADRFRFDSLLALGLWLLLALASFFQRLLPLPAEIVGQGEPGVFETLSHWHLFPGSVIAQGVPAPDVLLAITLCWVLRRPSQIPALAVVLVFFIEDLLTFRPPGLWPLIMLAGTEFLRRRHAAVRELNLLLEWGIVAGVMTAMLIAYRLALALVMVPTGSPALSLVQLVFTVAIYPVVAVLLQTLLRVRKPATGEVDELGRRL